MSKFYNNFRTTDSETIRTRSSKMFRQRCNIIRGSDLSYGHSNNHILDTDLDHAESCYVGGPGAYPLATISKCSCCLVAAYLSSSPASAARCL